MSNYKDTVISIIGRNGIEISLESSPKDEKHISAYIRLLDRLKIDYFDLLNYINSNERLGSITGFDISKHISSEGNIVFFHTDVHNSFNNIKKASIMIPEELTEVQLLKLRELIDDLHSEDFTFYFGQVKKKSKRKKPTYQVFDYKRLIKERNK